MNMKCNSLVLAAALSAASVGSAFGNSVDRAVSLLKDLEGFSPTVYTCAAGRRTIGYGFTSAAMVAKGTITREEADAELRRICTDLSSRIRTAVGGTLSEGEEAALISFVYNVGWGNFSGSTMLRLLRSGSRGAAVSGQFARWVYITVNGRKTVSRGLRNRRDRETALFLSP